SSLKELRRPYDVESVGIGAGRRGIACALALAAFVVSAPPPGFADDRDSRRQLRSELSDLLRQLSAVAGQADRASASWMAARIAEMEARAAEEAARAAFEDRVRHAYMAGP